MHSFEIQSNLRKNITTLQSDVVDLGNSVSFLNIQFNNKAQKGINIDDTTAALSPSTHNPMQSTDTFPSWPEVSSQITNIRTFHYNDQTPAKAWVRWAVENHIKVMVGLSLGSDSAAAELAAFSSDYMSADASLKALYDANVLAIAIGNEETNTTAINAGIANAKNKISLSQLPNVPVTSVLIYNTNWINNDFPPQNATFTANFLALAPNLDIVCFNCYGGYYSKGTLPPLTPEQALTVSLSWTSNSGENSVLLNQFGAIRYAMSKAGIAAKPFWCTETGWASTPEGNEVASWSSIPNLKTFYGNFLGYNMSNTFFPQSSTPAVNPPSMIFYFSIRDIPPQTKYFGLFTSSSTLSSKVC